LSIGELIKDAIPHNHLCVPPKKKTKKKKKTFPKLKIFLILLKKKKKKSKSYVPCQPPLHIVGLSSFVFFSCATFTYATDPVAYRIGSFFFSVSFFLFFD